jgi:hypothetical protein
MSNANYLITEVLSRRRDLRDAFFSGIGECTSGTEFLTIEKMAFLMDKSVFTFATKAGLVL